MSRLLVHRLPARQTGFSLVAAIFLVVVLSSLGAFMISVSTVQTATPTLQLQSARALEAAKSGLEWAAYEVIVDGNCPNAAFVAQGFTVNVTCTNTTHRVGSVDLLYSMVTATASIGVYGAPDFTARSVQAKFAGP